MALSNTTTNTKTILWLFPIRQQIQKLSYGSFQYNDKIHYGSFQYNDKRLPNHGRGKLKF
ncbi:hypothetical protein AP064_00980 [Candidatus Liberibacter solanacearum]|nr:hypothetical protein AP064_00980 [Candidatus Liberibacter solanacearum]